MGDPRKHRPKFKTPLKRWDKKRIEDEKIIIEQYGLKNKREIYKAESKIRAFGAQAKRLIRERGAEQAQKEEKQLLDKLVKWGLLEIGCKLEDVLGLTVHNLLDRRLQTIVFKKGLSTSVKQARQFITHGHVAIKNQKIDIPSYIVLKEEQNTIEFNQKSTLADPEHPERSKKVKEKIKEVKELTEEERLEQEAILHPVVEV